MTKEEIKWLMEAYFELKELDRQKRWGQTPEQQNRTRKVLLCIFAPVFLFFAYGCMFWN